MATKFPTAIDLTGNELQNARFHNLGGAPSNPGAGRTYFNTSDLNVYVYNGTAWQYLISASQLLATRLDQLTAPNAALNLNGQRITSLADPTNLQDAATKAYVDSLVQGLKWKDAVRVASTGNLSLTGLQTVDGVSLAAGDRIAVMNQTTASANGIYVVASGAWVRATDADTAAEVFGMTFFVSEGSTNGNKTFNMTTDAPITLGTTALVFAQVGGGTSYGAGTGITISGSTIAVDTTVVARKATATIGNGSATSITVSHNLGVKAVHVGLRKVSTDEHWIPDVTSSTVNAVTLAFSTAPATNEFEVVVIG